MKKIAALAMSFAVIGVLAGNAFADNAQGQISFGPFSPNTSAFSNNDVGSGNTTDSGNFTPIGSFNDLSTNDSYNIDVKVKDSFNDSSTFSKDSHDDNSANQVALGQVNLNDSYADNINAADNQSTIFDGDVKIGSNGGGYGGYGDFGFGGYGGGGSGDNNINTGVMSNSVLGNDSALFSNVGAAANGSEIKDSTISTGSIVNQNLLNP
jgi:hypothetical protein